MLPEKKGQLSAENFTVRLLCKETYWNVLSVFIVYFIFHITLFHITSSFYIVPVAFWQLEFTLNVDWLCITNGVNGTKWQMAPNIIERLKVSA